MTALETVSTRLADMRRGIERDLGRKAQVEEDLENLRSNTVQYRSALLELQQALQVFQVLEGTWHRSFENKLAGLISRGLSLVFNEPLRFVLETKQRGDMSTMDFKLVQMVGDDELVTDIMGAKGGGVVAVVSFLLRVLILLASKPPLRPVMILDENFAMVSQEYVPNLAKLLRQLVDETGVQIILVTHEPLFGEHADVMYEVTQKNGISRYSAVKSHAEHIVRE